MKNACEASLLVLPPIALITVYQLAFGLWMASQPTWVSDQWQLRLYLRGLTLIGASLLWFDLWKRVSAEEVSLGESPPRESNSAACKAPYCD